ncbi:unnamed protein product [Coregonus sp. 'balchen']|nr:unnamed protein product [Coregonus sp. 'balchen']
MLGKAFDRVEWTFLFKVHYFFEVGEHCVNWRKLICLRLYPLQMVPLYITKNYFLELNKYLSDFIWHRKSPRLKMSKRQLLYNVGGLALPHSLFYNWACHAHITTEWLRD